MSTFCALLPDNYLASTNRKYRKIIWTLLLDSRVADCSRTRPTIMLLTWTRALDPQGQGSYPEGQGLDLQGQGPSRT